MTAPVVPVPDLGPDALLIDALMPRCDVTVAQHRIVHAPPAATYEAARRLDFRTVRSPLTDTAMWLRGLPDRLTGTAPTPPPRLVLGEGTGLPGWLLLGGRPGREITFGAVGRFWTPTMEWHDVPAAEFAGFTEPGWGKIVAAFVVTPYGAGSLLTYECRTVTTDPASRARFLRYWALVRPVVGHLFRATLETVARAAEYGQPDPVTHHRAEPHGAR